MTARPYALLADRYDLGPRLGRGGMSEVFLARDLRLDRDVAVKVLRPQLAVDDTLRRRFAKEARTAARLSHPNVVGVLDTGESGEVAYIVMERLAGTTLEDELLAGPLSEIRVRSVARQVLSALKAAHDAGIVHRDVKPANLLTCEDGTVKVTDFGIATALDEGQTVTRPGLLVGTPAYLAPERLSGSPATPACDLYSLAAVLYECLTGRRPFEGATTLELLAALRDHQPVPIRALRWGVDPDLARLVERALDRDPSRRPAGAAQMAALLDGGGHSGDPAHVTTRELDRARHGSGTGPGADGSWLLAATQSLELAAPTDTFALAGTPKPPEPDEPAPGRFRAERTSRQRPLLSPSRMVALSYLQWLGSRWAREGAGDRLVTAARRYRVPVASFCAFAFALGLSLSLPAASSVTGSAAATAATPPAVARPTSAGPAHVAAPKANLDPASIHTTRTRPIPLGRSKGKGRHPHHAAARRHHARTATSTSGGHHPHRAHGPAPRGPHPSPPPGPGAGPGPAGSQAKPARAGQAKGPTDHKGPGANQAKKRDV